MTWWQWALVVGVAVVSGVVGWFAAVYYIGRGMFRNM